MINKNEKVSILALVGVDIVGLQIYTKAQIMPYGRFNRR